MWLHIVQLIISSPWNLNTLPCKKKRTFKLTTKLSQDKFDINPQFTIVRLRIIPRLSRKKCYRLGKIWCGNNLLYKTCVYIQNGCQSVGHITDVDQRRKDVTTASLFSWETSFRSKKSILHHTAIPTHTTQEFLIWYMFLYRVPSFKSLLFLKKWANPGPFSVYFSSFQHVTI